MYVYDWVKRIDLWKFVFYKIKIYNINFRDN